MPRWKCVDVAVRVDNGVVPFVAVFLLCSTAIFIRARSETGQGLDVGCVQKGIYNQNRIGIGRNGINKSAIVCNSAMLPFPVELLVEAAESCRVY